MATLLLFGPARSAAGRGRAEIEARTVGELCDAARRQFGEGFAEVLAASALWLNGEPVDGDPAVSAGDEVAVLPPVSGGA
ncbi:MAG: MoaD/ThiS family protein [Acidimicrobiales bacterium]